MNDVTDCLILSHTDYKDNSLLINALTEKYGKLSFIASGVKKTSSKNASNILLYTCSCFSFDYSEDKTIFRLKNAKTNRYYRHMHEDIEYIAASTLISEASDHILLQECDLELQKKIYYLLEQAYDLLDKKEDSKIIVTNYLAKIMQLFGIGMEVESCVLCGNTKISAFSVEEGGFLCKECALKNHISYLEIEKLKAIRYLNKATLEQYPILKEYVSKDNILVSIFVQFYEMHVGYKLKSFSFYERFCH